MPDPSLRNVAPLFDQLETFHLRAHVPFSGRTSVAIILMQDGNWIPGVRVESASYSLLIPSLRNAYTSMVALGVHGIAALLKDRPFRADELIYADSMTDRPMTLVRQNLLVAQGVSLPTPAPKPLPPFIHHTGAMTSRAGIELARSITSRAHVPESNFRVGAVLETEDGFLIPGVNVENEDWSRILCAERNAIGTAITYGFTEFSNLYLTCCKDMTCSPCGACRQLLAELTPDATLWMDRGANPEQQTTPESLLPASFTGKTLYERPPES